MPETTNNEQSWWHKTLQRIAKKQSLIGHFATLQLLRMERSSMIKKVNQNYLFNERASSSEQKKLVKGVDGVEHLITLNLGHIFNKVIRYLLIVGFLAPFFLFQKVNTTKISIDILASSVKWPLRKVSKDAGNWGMNANDSVEFSAPYQTVVSSPDMRIYPDNSQLNFAPVSPHSPITLSHIDLKNDLSAILQKPNERTLTVGLKSKAGERASIPFVYQISFLKKIVRSAGKSQLLEAPPAILSFKLQQLLRPGKPFEIAFDSPGDWVLPDRLYTDSLFFLKDELSEGLSSSSVLGGQVKILETADSAINLYERDTLEINFIEPVEIFVKSTKKGIMIHAEGEASKVLCGSPILKDANNRMPRRIKTWVDRSPYLISILGLLIPVLLALYIRQRRAI